jgi:hypothetical protein
MNLNKQENLNRKRAEAEIQKEKLNPDSPPSTSFPYGFFNNQTESNDFGKSYWAIVSTGETWIERLQAICHVENILGRFLYRDIAQKRFKSLAASFRQNGGGIERKSISKNSNQSSNGGPVFQEQGTSFPPGSNDWLLIRDKDGNIIERKFRVTKDTKFKDYRPKSPGLEMQQSIRLDLRKIPFFPEPNTKYLFDDGWYPPI